MFAQDSPQPTERRTGALRREPEKKREKIPKVVTHALLNPDQFIKDVTAHINKKNTFRGATDRLDLTQLLEQKIPQVYDHLSQFVLYLDKENTSRLNLGEIITGSTVALLRRYELLNSTNSWETSLADFWNNEVGRLHLFPSGNSSEDLYQLDGDPELRGVQGEFCIGFELAQPAEVMMGLAKLIHTQLNVLVVDRKINGPTNAIPLPQSEYYSVTIKRFGVYKKVFIPHSALQDPAGISKIHSLLTHNLLENEWDRYTDENRAEVKKSYDNQTSLQKVRANRLYTKEPNAADVVIVLNNTQDVTADFVQNDWRSNTQNAMVSWSVGINEKTGKIERMIAKNLHPAVDGAPAAMEEQLIANQVDGAHAPLLSKIRANLNLKDESAFSTSFRPLSQIEKNNFTRYGQEKEKPPALFHLRLSDDILKELEYIHAQEKAGNALHMSKADQHQKNPTEKIEKKKGVMTIQGMLMLAILAATNNDIGHWLEKDKNDSLSPAIAVGDLDILQKAAAGKILNPAESERILVALKMLSEERSDVYNGRGTARVLGTLVGDLRDVIAPASALLDKKRAKLVSQTDVMVSGFVSSNRRNVDLEKAESSARMSFFGTAFSTNYAEQVIGLQDIDAHTIALHVRSRKSDRTDFSQFEKKVTKAFEEIVHSMYAQSRI